MSAAFLVLVTIAATRAAVDDSGGARSAGPVPGSLAGTATGASLPAADLPAVDYTIDLDNGLMTPLPETILNSLGPAYVARAHMTGPFRGTPSRLTHRSSPT